MESNTLKFVLLKEEPDPYFPRTWFLFASCNQVHEAGIGIGLSRIIRLHTYIHTYTHTTYIHLYIHIHTHTHTHMHIYTHTYEGGPKNNENFFLNRIFL